MNNPLGLWKFSKNAIDSMKAIAIKTKKIERGANICYTKGTNDFLLDLDKECTGTSSDICSINKCKDKNKKHIGFYHTHLGHKEPNMSCGDMLNLKNNMIMCIGTQNEAITCFIKNPKLNEEEEQIIRKQLIICDKNQNILQNPDFTPKSDKEYERLLKISEELIPLTRELQRKYTLKFKPEECGE